MQLNGPYQVSEASGWGYWCSRRGPFDYNVKVKDKTNVYHAVLLKKYYEQEEVNDMQQLPLARAQYHK